MTSTLPQDCLSDLSLDRLVAGEHDLGAHAEHLNSCERCRARLARFREIDSASRATVERLSRLAVATSRQKTAFWNIPTWRFAFAGCTALLFAGVLLVVLRHHSVEIEVTRLKGDTIRFYSQRDGRVVASASGEWFKPGDALRFVVSTSEDSQLLLVGIESSGKISAYYPYRGTSSVLISAGPETTLPGSIILDESLDDEFVLALFHSKPVALADVRQALAALPASPPFNQAELQGMKLPGRLHWIVLHKKK